MKNESPNCLHFLLNHHLQMTLLVYDRGRKMSNIFGDDEITPGPCFHSRMCKLFTQIMLNLTECFISYLECKEKSLGLRKNDGLPYYYFQGTSYRPEIVKKHINKDLASNGATWCPEQSRANGSFLEVDLGKQYLLCGVSTQGDTDTNNFTTDYKIKLSSNRIHWKFFNNGTVIDSVILYSSSTLL